MQKWDTSDLIIWCLGNLGTDIHREHVYIEMHKLDPDRYSWRQYPDIPDMKKLDAVLTPVVKYEKLITRSSGWGLTLTVKGEKQYEKLLSQNIGDIDLTQKPAPIERWEELTFKSVEKDPIFNNWKTGKLEEDAWKDSDDCYRTLKVKPGLPNNKIAGILSDFTKKTRLYPKYKELDEFFNQSIINLKRS